MLRDTLRASLAHVALALHEPEEFAVAWDRQTRRYPWLVWLTLALTAVAGTLCYGVSMGLAAGPAHMTYSAIGLTMAAGLAWGIPLPALYILNSFSGSRLAASSTLLAVLVTTSWGGLAMLASIPINAFFMVAIPSLPWPRPVVVWLLMSVNLVVFAGVGVSMVDVFGRIVARLEPSRGRAPAICLALVAVIGAELFYALGLFDLAF